MLENLRAVFPGVKRNLKKKERKRIDSAELASAVTTFLAALLGKMGESTIAQVDAKLPEKLGGIWSAISNRFRDNPVAAGAASGLGQERRRHR